MQPDGGHEVLWVVREGLSPESLRARPFLSSTQGDLTAALTQGKPLLEPLAVPGKGIISAGEEPIRSVVALVVPEMPPHLCQFPAFKEATAPLYEADRQAKTHLQQLVRGVRPRERALEEHQRPENDAIRGSCLAVRAALTDEGRSPLEASGLRVHERFTQGQDSLARVQGKKDCPRFEAGAAPPRERRAGHSTPVAAA